MGFIEDSRDEGLGEKTSIFGGPKGKDCALDLTEIVPDSSSLTLGTLAIVFGFEREFYNVGSPEMSQVWPREPALKV